MDKSEHSAEWVAAYLQQNPDFFDGKDALLKEMQLPHPSGQAISLLEKQNDLLRREVGNLRERLQHLIATALDNDHLFLRLRGLVLALLEAETWPQLLAALNRGLTTQFDVDMVQVVAFTDDVPPEPTWVRSLSIDQLRDSHPGVVDQGKAWCGQTNKSILNLLFGDANAARVGSIALSPLMLEQQVVGLLALGSRDADYFRSSMDTLFLTHVTEVTSRLINRF